MIFLIVVLIGIILLQSAVLWLAYHTWNDVVALMGLIIDFIRNSNE